MNLLKQITRVMSHGTTAASTEATDAAWEAMDSPLFRLPTYLAPQHYAVEFQPNTTFNTFAGAVYITLKLVEPPPAPVTHVILHTLELTLHTSAVRAYIPHKGQTVLSEPPAHPSHRYRTAVPTGSASASPPCSSGQLPFSETEGRYAPCLRQRRSMASETTQLLFDTPLASAVGDVFVLLIERFDGHIDCSPSMVGLYHSSPTNPAVISTHLEPTHARRLFPCFDEPAIQATFQLSVVTDACLTVISNTEVEADVGLPVQPYCGKTTRSAPMRVDADADDPTRSRATPQRRRNDGEREANGEEDAGEEEEGEDVERGADHRAAAAPTSSLIAGQKSDDQAWQSPALSPSATPTALARPSSAFAGTHATNHPTPSSSSTPAAPVAASPFHCVRFQTTPPMHTCIIGFHVGRYTILEQRTRLSRVLCRVVLPHTEPSSSGWFALDLATKALDFFEEFFNVRLPLRKLDVVAMERFAVLGMENWGLINLHKDYLIVTGTTPLERRQRITRLIGHETCHQWFGNWISIEWWNNLWLKEGMCRYLEYFFVNAIFPSWGLWNEFLSVIMNDALLADADPSETHPVDCCNSAPRRIYDSFDTISYGKGACVLRMMFSIIGTEWLKRATHLLMTRFANRSFNAKDLGDCIVQTADARSSRDAQVQHAKAISYALQMVDAVSHPYLYIQQFPGEGYNITQYVAPSKQHGLLVEYLQSQRSKAGAPVIDLFSNPAHLSFEWKPEETLTRVSTAFAVPLRSAQWHRGGHGSVRLIFIEDAEHFVPLSSAVSSPSTSVHGGTGGGGALSAEVSTSSPLPYHRAATSPTEMGKSSEHDAPTSPISVFQQVCYFNHGGGGFYQCDYDAATWRQLFEFVAAFADEDRMVITLHFINTAKAQLGHQPDTLGDRCTLYFEWLLKLTSTPGAMNSYLWDIVTRSLTHLVLLVQQYYCQSMVKAFVNGLYMPLQKRCVLSFFAQEKTVSFQSSIHLSRHLVLSILQLLCLCENPEVMDEAEETAQWALARVAPGPHPDSPYYPGASPNNNNNNNNANNGGGGSSSGGNSTTASGCATATAAPLTADTLSSANNTNYVNSNSHNQNFTSPHSSGQRSTAPSPLATAPLGAPARRSSQVELGSGGNLPGQHSSPGGAAIGPKSSPVKVVQASGHLLTNSFASSASRALPTPQLACTPHGATANNANNNTDYATGGGSVNANLFNSFGGPPSAMDWAGVRNNSIASYPYQRAAELNLADASHMKAGEIALAHLASQGRMEHWAAAAAVAAEILEIERDELQRVCGSVVVPFIRLSGLDRNSRDDYLRLVLPAVFLLDREHCFPFMAAVFQNLSFLSAAAVEALYRNSRFLTYLIATGLLGNRRVLNYVLTCGAEICSNGFVIAQLKALAQGTANLHSTNSGNTTHLNGNHNGDSTAATPDASSVSSSVEMYKGVEFADTMAGAASSATLAGRSTAPSTAPSSQQSSLCTSASASAATASSERSTLRVQSPAVATALDMMEANCVWMDYCCWHYDNFLREQRQRQVWRPTRSEENSSMQMSAPAGDEMDEVQETFGGVSI